MRRRIMTREQSSGRGQPGTDALLRDLSSDTDDSDFDPTGPEELAALDQDREADWEMARARANGELADEDEPMLDDLEEGSEDGGWVGGVIVISTNDDETFADDDPAEAEEGGYEDDDTDADDDDDDDDDDDGVDDDEEANDLRAIFRRPSLFSRIQHHLLGHPQQPYPAELLGYQQYLQKLPIEPKAVQGDIAISIRNSTAAEDPRLARAPPSQASDEHAKADAVSPRVTRRWVAGPSREITSPTPAQSPLAPAPVTPRQLLQRRETVTPRQLLQRRETGQAGEGFGCAPSGLTSAQCKHVGAYSTVPQVPIACFDKQDDACYTAEFSQDGTIFVAGFQSRKIRMYDVTNHWKLIKDMRMVNFHWTITDTAISHDTRFLLYGTLHNIAYKCDVAASEGVSSISNVTDVHHGFDFSHMEGQQPDERVSPFRIWSLRLNGDSTEALAGTDGIPTTSRAVGIFIHNLERQRTVATGSKHEDDVNAVAYLDPDSCNTIVSGADDAVIYVWDRRTMGRRCTQPQGVLLGPHGGHHMSGSPWGWPVLHKQRQGPYH
eukprot:jgi/Botrbrau1/14538/Bobra.0212s0005.1